METYRKNSFVLTESQAQDLLTAQDDFYNNPVMGKADLLLDSHLLKIWNGGNHLSWEWSDESQQEYNQRTAKKAAEKAELSKLKNDNKYFKNVKIRPWRNQKLVEWIDDTYIRPLFYDLKSNQESERKNKRLELLDWPALDDFDTHKTDTEIDALKPSAPSWIT